MPVFIPTQRLRRHCNPFGRSPWCVRVTRLDVRRALRERRLISVPGTSDHAGRIAYLVENPATDPIDIDVGVPVLGFIPRWMIQDGNHRLAAAIFSGKTEVLAEVQGQLNYAKRLFGLDCENEC